MARFGVATIVNGQVAGVSGCYHLRRSAERSARRRRNEIDLTATPVDGYRVVRRTSPRSGDWGVRPESAGTNARPESGNGDLDEPENGADLLVEAPSDDKPVTR